ncbi:hypothetical protein HanRHA438_Chr13g0601601 [Helianthus annuus]|nr:hypothetical protein HanIR_Chr13g0643161 [Helianthus annuus]KAJ0858490.1 hypothetical protein HanRHA438_Chr13g0601601 [Helianthus annuus]
MLIHKMDMGNEVKSRRRMALCKHRPRPLCFPAPNAWAQMGSIPMARPERMEYPVMLAKPTASDPPARDNSPRCPRKSMEIIDREYISIPVRIMGIAMWDISMASWIANEIWDLWGLT